MLKGLEVESILTLNMEVYVAKQMFLWLFFLSILEAFGLWISGDGYGNLSSLVKVGTASSKIALHYCRVSSIKPPTTEFEAFLQLRGSGTRVS